MNKARFILLPSASRAVNTASSPLETKHAIAVRLYLTVTAIAGGTGLTAVLRGYDSFGNAVELTAGGTPVTANGTYCYEISGSNTPAAAAGGTVDAISRHIPMTWDVLMKAGGTTATYALSAEVMDGN